MLVAPEDNLPASHTPAIPMVAISRSVTSETLL